MDHSAFTNQIEVHLTSDSKTRQGIAFIREWDKKGRIKRALKTLAICWGLMIISILIPIAHFILVPSFLILGPFLAFKVYRTQSMLIGGTGKCPHCDHDFLIEKSHLNWPLHDLCSFCQSSVIIYQKQISS